MLDSTDAYDPDVSRADASNRGPTMAAQPCAVISKPVIGPTCFDPKKSAAKAGMVPSPPPKHSITVAAASVNPTTLAVSGNVPTAPASSNSIATETTRRPSRSESHAQQRRPPALATDMIPT